MVKTGDVCCTSCNSKIPLNTVHISKTNTWLCAYCARGSGVVRKGQGSCDHPAETCPLVDLNSPTCPELTREAAPLPRWMPSLIQLLLHTTQATTEREQDTQRAHSHREKETETRERSTKKQLAAGILFLRLNWTMHAQFVTVLICFLTLIKYQVI